MTDNGSVPLEETPVHRAEFKSVSLKYNTFINAAIIIIFIHTFYLSQTPQTCLCKNFLSGVNFSRMSEKMHIYDFFRDIFSVFGDFSRLLGCKIWFSKILSV